MTDDKWTEIKSPIVGHEHQISVGKKKYVGTNFKMDSLAEFVDGFIKLKTKLAYTKHEKQKEKPEEEQEMTLNYPEFYQPTALVPESQKARGIAWLMQNKNNTHIKNTGNIPDHVFFKVTQKPNPGDKIQFPVFVRPCPMTPRHGFVDSRPVANFKQLLEIFEETYEVEPEAEIAITKPIPAKYSAILANNVITIGPGNDGATSGKESLVFPVELSHFKDFPIPESIVGPDETPFFEFVSDVKDSGSYGLREELSLVQVRSVAGDVNLGQKDFIPEKTVVKTILKAGGELLEWEQNVKNAEEGTVLYVPNGGLASHYAIHGVLNNVPVVTSFEPEVGQTIEANTSSVNLEDNIEEFQEGFNKSLTAEFDGLHSDLVIPRLRYRLRYILGVLHNSAALIKQNRLFELGAACGLFYRITGTLCVGEARHHPSSNWSGSRNKVYNDITNINLTHFNVEMKDALNLFITGSWSGGYGGSKWAQIAKGGCGVYNTAVKGKVKEAISLLNNAIHLEHNNGWFMNKIDGKNAFNIASNKPDLYILKNMGVIYEVNRALNLVKKQANPKTFSAKSLKKKEKVVKKDKTKKAKELIKYVQIRLLKPSQNLSSVCRIQIKYGDYDKFCEIDKDPDLTSLTKQSKKLLSEYKGKFFDSMAGTNQQYVKLQLKGKHSKWWCLNDKRIISHDEIVTHLSSYI